MGFYRNRLLPRLQDLAMSRGDLRAVRARVCQGLHGDVVEIGFGTGINADFYPPEVAKLIAIEPSALCMRLAGPRIARTSTPVELAGLTGEKLELPSDSFDAVLSTWTLCTIPDVDAALAEVHRVLRPGGEFHFVEHGHAPDPKFAAWQQRIEPAWKRVAGGCHVTRPIADLIERAGFGIDSLETYYREGEPKIFGYNFEGIARKA
ncbi:MAG TPA: class I SAM-dependent methyltransferase [Actinomycetota bacterium]|nr:class I SAM-dependent methyltransferase [Actinomycetota bacterium]